MRVDGEDACFEAQVQIALQPFIEVRTFLSRGEALDAPANNGNCNCADEYIVFVSRGEPCEDSRIGAKPRRFGKHVGVEEKTHRSTLRNPPRKRLTRRLEFRRGEFIRNSARFPLRSFFFSHSEGETTTAVVRP